MALEEKLTEEEKVKILEKIENEWIEITLDKLCEEFSIHPEYNLAKQILILEHQLKEKYQIYDNEAFRLVVEKYVPVFEKIGDEDPQKARTQIDRIIEELSLGELTQFNESIPDFFWNYLGSRYVLRENGNPKNLDKIALSLINLAKGADLNYTRLNNILGFNQAHDFEEIIECSQIGSNYQVVCRLGKGSSGTTYKVYSPELKKYRALKIINDKFTPKEAELMAKLEGKDLENIVQIYEAGDHIVTVNGQKKYAILMEFVDGETLREIMDRGPFNEEIVLHLSYQLFKGICALRNNGITHRDINPKNIKINRHVNLKILDFGIATDELNPLPKDARTYGSPNGFTEYMDFFSFGLITYELATGKHLFFPKSGIMDMEVKKTILDEEGGLRLEYRNKIPDYLKVPLLLSLGREQKYQSIKFAAIKTFYKGYLSYYCYPLTIDEPLGENNIPEEYYSIIKKCYPFRIPISLFFPKELDQFIDAVNSNKDVIEQLVMTTSRFYQLVKKR